MPLSSRGWIKSDRVRVHVKRPQSRWALLGDGQEGSPLFQLPNSQLPFKLWLIDCSRWRSNTWPVHSMSPIIEIFLHLKGAYIPLCNSEWDSITQKPRNQRAGPLNQWCQRMWSCGNKKKGVEVIFQAPVSSYLHNPIVPFACHTPHAHHPFFPPPLTPANYNNNHILTQTKGQMQPLTPNILENEVWHSNHYFYSIWEKGISENTYFNLLILRK